MKRLIILFILVLSFSCSSSKNSSDKIKILIIDGFSNHDWQATTQTLQTILKKDNSFIVEVSTVPKKSTSEWKIWKPLFMDYDVIIQTTNDYGNGGEWPIAAKLSFEKYITNGGGLLVYHSANNAFRDWTEYNNMIGLGWRHKNFGKAVIIEDGKPVIIAKGDGENTGHGQRFDALVTRIDNHPIHNGLPKQWLAADIEVYRYARGPATNMSVLSYGKDAQTGLNFPIEWVVEYGKGRVYNSTYGHYWHGLKSVPAGMRCVAFQTLFLRAVKWLAKAEVKSSYPKNFPTKDQISLYD